MAAMQGAEKAWLERSCLPRAEVWQGAWNVAEEDTSLWSLTTGRFSRIYLEPLVVSGESFSHMAHGAQKSPRGNQPLSVVCP